MEEVPSKHLKQKSHCTTKQCSSHKVQSTQAINWIWVPLTLVVIISFSCSMVKPLHQSSQKFSCECTDESYVRLSEVDKTIKRYNPNISATVYLSSNYGSPVKTLKVYSYRNKSGIERVLLFHFSDMFSYELKLDTLIIEGENVAIKKKIFDDASVIIGNAQDLIFYITIYAKEYEAILGSNGIRFRIDDMSLELHADCKNKVLL